MSNQMIESKGILRKRISTSFFCIVLCISLCISFFSCTGKTDTSAEDKLSEVRKELKSYSWVLKDVALGSTYTKIYKFENGGTYKETFYIGSNTANATTSYGTYIVTDCEILYTDEDGREHSLTYSFEDGILELTIRGIKLVKSN